MSPITLMECAKIVITQKEGLRERLTVVIQRECYMQRVFAKIATFQFTTRAKGLLRKEKIIIKVMK